MIEKKIGRYISIFMGIAMSVTMSVIGSLMGTLNGIKNAKAGMDAAAAAGGPPAGAPPFIVQWLPSLGLSLIITVILAIGIGLIVPMKKVNDGIEAKTGTKGFVLHLLQSLVSDLIYTPIISLVMAFVSTAVFTIPHMPANVPHPPLPIMALGSFGRSVIIEFLVALVVIMIIEPIIQKAAFKKYIPNFGESVDGDDAI